MMDPKVADVIEKIEFTFLGFLLGMIGNSLGNLTWSKYSTRQKRRQYLKGLERCLERNYILLSEVTRQLKKSHSPTFNCDTVFLESTTVLKYELLDELDLPETIDHLNHELDHISIKLDQLRSYHILRHSVSNPEGWKIFTAAIINHVPQAKALIIRVHEKIPNSFRKTIDWNTLGEKSPDPQM